MNTTTNDLALKLTDVALLAGLVLASTRPPVGARTHSHPARASTAR
jgi:hypothetical protein